MKQLFTFIIALFAFAAIQAQTPITLINGDFEDPTEMAKNSSDKWAVKGFFLNDFPATPAGIYVNDANSGLAPGQGDGGTQAFKVTIVQPDATSNTTYHLVNLTTDSIDISNREFGKYIYKFYIKTADVLLKVRPWYYSYTATDANGVDVTAFTAISNETEQKILNETSVFNTTAATEGYQALHGVVDVTANTNTDSNLGSVLNAKYIKFQFAFGKQMPDPGATGKPSTTFYFDNFSLTGPAVNATLSTDASLSSLTLDNGTLSPAFSAEQLNYTVVLPNGTTTVPTVSATTTHANATTVITQAANLSGTEAERKATVEVTAEDGTTKSNYTVVISVLTSVNNYMLNDRVKMYPNPATDIINIEIAGTYNKTSEIIFYNSLGLELKREVLNSENTKIDISSFQLGIYHAVIISKNSVEWRGSFAKNK